MQFLFFLILNAVLLLRPEELIRDWQGSRLYLVASVACLLATLGPLFDGFKIEKLIRRPVTVCVLGIWAAVVVSDLSRGQTWPAFEHGEEFAKNALLFLLGVALINSPQRLQVYLSALLVGVAGLATLGLMGFHGILDLPALKPIMQNYYDPVRGEIVAIPRMVGTGIFNDPNDLSVMLCAGVFLTLYKMTSPGAWMFRPLGLALLALFGTAIMATQSRGGLLALVIGVVILCINRFGRKFGVLFAVVAAAGLLTVYSGRQTELSFSSDTGNERLKLWAEGLSLLQRYPVFGIGYGNYADGVGQVAHNSYIHAFVELGLFGGMMFTLAAYLMVVGPLAVPSADPTLEESDFERFELLRFRPYLLAIVGSYAGGMLSLSRTYTLTTYIMLALSAAYCQLGLSWLNRDWYRCDRAMIGRLFGVGVVTLILHKLVAQFLTQWGGGG